MRKVQLFKGKSRIWSVKTFIAGVAVVCAAGAFAGAQNGVMSPYQGERDGVSVGGKWVEFRSEDKMTAAKKVRFELQADNYLSSSPNYKPRVDIFCTNHKYESASFNPGIPLGPPNRPGFWGQPQIQVRVRVDSSHHSVGWNWMQNQFLSMDKGTAREMIGSQIFKIEMPGRRGSEIAEFSPGGLDLSQVKQACDVTPKKPSKD